VIKLHDLSFSYGSVQALRGVNMSMPPGQVTCVIGRNGVRKTTLMKTVMGLLRHSAGQIYLGEHSIEHLPANRRAKLGVALVPQGRQIFPKLSVEENLRIGLQARTDGRKSVPDEIYELFPVLKTMSSRMGGDLSGGQQQQLAIGRALVLEPTLLILDEPTEGIQPNIVHEIGDILLDLNRDAGLTVLVVEQQLRFARRVASQFCILEKGRGVAAGPIDELTDDVVRAHLSV